MKKILLIIILLIVVHLKNGENIIFSDANDYFITKNNELLILPSDSLFKSSIASFNMNEVLYVEKKIE